MVIKTFKNAKILIIDDQHANIEVMEGFLQLEGYEFIKTLNDSRLFKQTFLEFDPDLILLDLNMPVISGFDILVEIDSLINPNIFLPVLVLTADITTEAREKALTLGANDFLTKPYDLIEVGLRIKNLLYIRHLHKQLQIQNKILEEKVIERTEELEKTNKDLIVAKEKAEASDRLKTAFLQNISHEVRTPLNGILGFSHLLMEGEISEAEKIEFTYLLGQSSDRLLKTITDYIDISMLVSGTMELILSETNINDTINEVIRKFRNFIAEKEIKIHLQIDDIFKKNIIKTDHYIIDKTFSHLLDNAIKFTASGEIILSAKYSANEIVCFVKDNGKGIEKEFRESIFESFIQENTSNTRDYEGSGLGLSIAKKLIELLDGKIWLESEVNVGTTVYFSFPYCLEEEVVSTDFIYRSTSGFSSKAPDYLNVLIVDDDEMSELLIDYILEKLNYTIYRAKTGLQAIDICKKHPEIDLILMDIKLPDLNGFEATKIIREFNQKVKIFAQTAYALPGDKEKALQSGCNDYLPKPYNDSLLIAKIRKHF